MTIEIDRKVLIEALQGNQHSRILLQRDYCVGKDHFVESLDVDGCGVYGGKVRLTIARTKVDEAPK